MDKNSGEAKPGKKGITLNTSQWNALTAAILPLSEQLVAVEVGGVEQSSKSKIGSEKVQKVKRYAVSLIHLLMLIFGSELRNPHQKRKRKRRKSLRMKTSMRINHLPTMLRARFAEGLYKYILFIDISHCHNAWNAVHSNAEGHPEIM